MKISKQRRIRTKLIDQRINLVNLYNRALHEKDKNREKELAKKIFEFDLKYPDIKKG